MSCGPASAGTGTRRPITPPAGRASSVGPEPVAPPRHASGSRRSSTPRARARSQACTRWSAASCMAYSRPDGPRRTGARCAPSRPARARRPVPHRRPRRTPRPDRRRAGHRRSGHRPPRPSIRRSSGGAHRSSSTMWWTRSRTVHPGSTGSAASHRPPTACTRVANSARCWRRAPRTAVHAPAHSGVVRGAPPVDDDDRLVADHPGVVPGRQRRHLPGRRVELLAVGRADAQRAGHVVLEVRRLAQLGAGERLDVDRPAPARLAGSAGRSRRRRCAPGRAVRSGTRGSRSGLAKSCCS